MCFCHTFRHALNLGGGMSTDISAPTKGYSPTHSNLRMGEVIRMLGISGKQCSFVFRSNLVFLPFTQKPIKHVLHACKRTGLNVECAHTQQTWMNAHLISGRGVDRCKQVQKLGGVHALEARVVFVDHAIRNVELETLQAHDFLLQCVARDQAIHVDHFLLANSVCPVRALSGMLEVRCTCTCTSVLQIEVW